jgi:hypothetical protein
MAGNHGVALSFKACSVHLHSEALLRSALFVDRIRRCAAPPPIELAFLSDASYPYCRLEEDPFLLLESSLKAFERILQLGLLLRHTWIEQPCEEE